MNNRRLALVLVRGLVVAMFVSACGVAVGPVQFITGGPAILSPSLTGLHLPGLTALRHPAVMGWMPHAQRVLSSVQSVPFYWSGHVGCDGGH